MSWVEKLNLKKILWDKEEDSNKVVPEGLWLKCDSCDATLYRPDIEKANHVCPKCDHHMKIKARERLNDFLDEGSSLELDPKMRAIDILKFKDSQKYTDRLLKATRNTGEKEALICMTGKLHARPVIAVAFEFEYMGGSMGSVVGEKFVRAANKALETAAPLICFSASGGARMQESMHSLMQMAKTSAVLKQLQKERVPFISVLCHPTMGGVSASLAMLGDFIIAEPKASIGFAGRRVIEQTVGENLPDDFQKSEFLLENGAIDLIVHRNQLKHKIGKILALLDKKASTPDQHKE